MLAFMFSPWVVVLSVVEATLTQGTQHPAVIGLICRPTRPRAKAIVTKQLRDPFLAIFPWLFTPHDPAGSVSVTTMSDAGANTLPRPKGEELDRRLKDVQDCAHRVARGDTGLARRGDVDPEDVAQDIALQYLKRATEPMSLFGWVASATRCRLIDLARKKRPAAVGDDELFRQMKREMGPSAEFMARDQYQRVIATLGPVQQAVINEYLTGATNAQIARSHDYASPAVAAATISRIKKDLRSQFPDMRFDLAPQRVY
jgi:DNA-directed RNA polymerase specialized sigma24 family protein